jgi:hypothetical protein
VLRIVGSFGGDSTRPEDAAHELKDRQFIVADGHGEPPIFVSMCPFQCHCSLAVNQARDIGGRGGIQQLDYSVSRHTE